MRLLCILLDLYTFPVDKAVHVVAKEGNETNDHRQIGKGNDGGECPQPDEDDIVCGVRKRVIAAA